MVISETTNRTKRSIFSDHVRGTSAGSVFTDVCHSVHVRGWAGSTVI